MSAIQKIRVMWLYPEITAQCIEDDEFPYISDYDPYIKSLGELMVRVDTEDYQGDTLIFFACPDGRPAYLEIGWGSCSACDPLQSCRSVEEIAELLMLLDRQIVYFQTKEEAIDYFSMRDWKGSFLWWDQKRVLRPFLEKVFEVLGKECPIIWEEDDE